MIPILAILAPLVNIINYLIITSFSVKFLYHYVVSKITLRYGIEKKAFHIYMEGFFR